MNWNPNLIPDSDIKTGPQPNGIGIIIPDRGDRPDFWLNCLSMIHNQIIWKDKPVFIAHIDANEVQAFNHCDITKRYRVGYDQLRRHNLEVIFFFENDDWYHPEYCQYMYNKWIEHGRPMLFGSDHTIFYHLRLRSYRNLVHHGKACMFQSMIVPDLDFKWPHDHVAYTDIELYRLFRHMKMNKIKPDGNNIASYELFTPDKLMAVGMKHGQGLVGGGSHNTELERFIIPDNDFAWMKEKIYTSDPASFEFYVNKSAVLNS